MDIGPSFQNFTPRPLHRIPLIMLPNFQQYCFPLDSAPHIPSSQTQDQEGMLGCAQESVGTLAGRLSCPRAAGFKVRHLDPSSQTKTAAQRLDKGWTGEPGLIPGPVPHRLPFPSLDPPPAPILHQGLANGVMGGGRPSLPPPSHTHSPFFLKSPRSAGRWRPRNTTMTAGATQTSLPRPLQNARRQPSTKGCGPPACRPAAERRSRRRGRRGRGCSPGPPPTCATGPAPLLTPPPSGIQGLEPSQTHRVTAGPSLWVLSSGGQYD